MYTDTKKKKETHIIKSIHLSLCLESEKHERINVCMDIIFDFFDLSL